MSEEIKKSVVTDKIKTVSAKKPEGKRFNISIEGDDGEKFAFSGPEGAKYINIEKAAYRLLTEFIVLRWRDSIIKDAKEKEAKEAKEKTYSVSGEAVETAQALCKATANGEFDDKAPVPKEPTASKAVLTEASKAEDRAKIDAKIQDDLDTMERTAEALCAEPAKIKK